MMLQHQTQLQTIPLDSKYFCSAQSQTSSGSSFRSSISSQSDADLLPDLWQEDSHQNAMMDMSLPRQLKQMTDVQMTTLFQSQQQVQLPPMWNDSIYENSMDFNCLLPNNLANELNAFPRKGSNFSDKIDDIFDLEIEQQRNQQQQQHSQQLQLQQQQHNINNSNNNKHTPQSPTSDHHHSKNKHQPVNTQLYKTELCASFGKMGVCPYGTKCQFAHGLGELKKVDRPPKWRSKPCANWTKYGSCRYGNRCCFKHGE